MQNIDHPSNFRPGNLNISGFVNHWAAGMNGGKPELSGNKNKETKKGTNN